MKDKDKRYLLKLIEYINDTLDYTDVDSYQEFSEDKKTLSACAFNISQIGELIGNLSDEFKEKYPYIPWRSIKGMRNKIVHDYEHVNLSVLWSTIKKDLPQLSSQLSNILNQ